MLDTLFGGGKEAAAKAMQNQLKEGLSSGRDYTNRATNALNPFLQREQGLYNEYLGALRQNQDPSQLLSMFMNNYRMSPEAQAQIEQGQQAANSAAAASGMLGSGSEQTAAASRAQSTRSQDMQDYLNRLMNLYSYNRGQYLGGLQGLQGQGFNAGSNIAQMLFGQGGREMDFYKDMANAAAARETGRAGGIGNAIGQGLGIAGSLAGLLL